MSNISIQPKNFVLKTNSSFRFDFDIVSGEDRIQSITAGGAIDDYNYLFVFSPDGRTREFTFDFLPLKKPILSTSILNMIIRIMDVDGGIFEFAFSKNYAIESGLPSISNPRISQRSDGSKLIDIEYDYDSPNEIDPAYVYFQISTNFGETWTAFAMSSFGDVGYGVMPGPNRKITLDSEEFSITETTPLAAKIFVMHSSSVLAVGNNLTGTLMLTPSEKITPVLSIASSNEKTRFGKQNGNLYKNNSIDFDPIELPSSSSESSESELSESSDSSSTYNSDFLALGFIPDDYNGTYYGHIPDGDGYGGIWRMTHGEQNHYVTIYCASDSSHFAVMINWNLLSAFRQTQPGGKLPNSYPWDSTYPDYTPGVFTEI